jgi:Leucine-rich repeat (LRR) protein
LLLPSPCARANKQEDDALRAVQKIGAFVTRDEKTPGRPVIGVDFYFDGFKGSPLPLLQRFPHLRTLGLARWFPSDSEFQELAKFKELHTLKVGYGSLTVVELKSLLVLKELRSLDLPSVSLLRSRTQGPPDKNGREDRSNLIVGSGFVDLKVLAALPKLESLNLHATHFGDENFKDLTPLTRLKDVSLGGNYTSIGANLGALAALRQLRSLDLSDSYLTRPGTRALGRLTSLRRLNVHHTELASGGPGGSPPPHEPWPDGLADLTTLRQLLELDLSDNRGATDEGLKALAPLAQLQALSLRGTPVTDDGLAALAAFRRLKSLNLSATAISDRGIEKVLELPALDTLDLSYTKVTDVGIKKLADLKALRSLNLSGTTLTDHGLRKLSSMGQLEKLLLTSTAGTEVGLKALGALRALKTLELPDTKTTDAVLKELAHLKGLEVLDLSGTLVSDAGIKELTGLQRLQTLRLRYTQVTDTGIKELAALGALERLELENSRGVSDVGVNALSNLAHLNYLDVMMTRVSPVARDRLRDVLPGLNTNP